MQNSHNDWLRDLFPAVSALQASLVRRGWALAVAESCTGGLLAAAITAVPGSSAYFRGGIVAYADDIKQTHLDVSRQTLQRYGAVSSEVVTAMAVGVQRALQANVGIGITGIAGPAAEGDVKSPGLIYVACATPQSAVAVERLNEDQGRSENRIAAVRAAISLCLKLCEPT